MSLSENDVNGNPKQKYTNQIISNSDMLLFCITTVSYTHLDVYKRQELYNLSESLAQ